MSEPKLRKCSRTYWAVFMGKKLLPWTVAHTQKESIYAHEEFMREHIGDYGLDKKIEHLAKVVIYEQERDK